MSNDIKGDLEDFIKYEIDNDFGPDFNPKEDSGSDYDQKETKNDLLTDMIEEGKLGDSSEQKDQNISEHSDQGFYIY